MTVLKSLNWRLIILSVLSVSIITNLVVVLVAMGIEASSPKLSSGGIVNPFLRFYVAYCVLFLALINGAANYFYSRKYKFLQALISVILTAILSFIVFFYVTSRAHVINRLDDPCTFNYSPGVCGD